MVILTVMMIAMKSYLLIPLFFVGLLCLHVPAFSQEDSSPDSPATSQTVQSVESLPADHQEEEEFKHDMPQHEFPGVWIDPVERESDTFQAKFFNMLVLLGLLIGFMILASWALKRLMKTKMTNLNTASYIKVLDTRYLSPRATLYLIEVQDKAFLIAESPTAVTYLGSVPLEEEQP